VPFARSKFQGVKNLAYFLGKMAPEVGLVQYKPAGLVVWIFNAHLPWTQQIIVLRLPTLRTLSANRTPLKVRTMKVLEPI
jgi:hypothetical protein